MVEDNVLNEGNVLNLRIFDITVSKQGCQVTLAYCKTGKFDKFGSNRQNLFLAHFVKIYFVKTL